MDVDGEGGEEGTELRGDAPNNLSSALSRCSGSISSRSIEEDFEGGVDGDGDGDRELSGDDPKKAWYSSWRAWGSRVSIGPRSSAPNFSSISIPAKMACSNE